MINKMEQLRGRELQFMDILDVDDMGVECMSFRSKNSRSPSKEALPKKKKSKKGSTNRSKRQSKASVKGKDEPNVKIMMSKSKSTISSRFEDDFLTPINATNPIHTQKKTLSKQDLSENATPAKTTAVNSHITEEDKSPFSNEHLQDKNISIEPGHVKTLSQAASEENNILEKEKGGFLSNETSKILINKDIEFDDDDF